MSSNIRSHIATIQSQIGILEALAADEDALAMRAESVSAWSVARQVEHMLLTCRVIFKQIDRILAGDGETSTKPSLPGKLLLTVGKIPRGLGKAPKFIHPTDRSPDEIRALVTDCRERLDGFTTETESIAASRAIAKHPFFGAFTPTMWLRFVDVHNRHHLAIIDDIRSA